MAYQYNPTGAPAFVPLTLPLLRKSTDIMDDIDMMDEDILLEAPAATTITTAQPQEQQQPGGPVPEAYFMDLDEIGKIVPEKVHANGVDDMTTEQVTAWADGHTVSADVKVKKVEWIDDSSCRATQIR